MNETECWFWLCNIPGLSEGKINILLKHFGSPGEIYKADIFDLKRVFKITDTDIKIIFDSKKNKEILKKLDYLYNEGIRFIYPGHAEYPERLLNIPDAPISLYVKGNLPSDTKPSVAMVGARNYSTYGKHCGKFFAGDFASHGIQVISGLARGIDSVCMESAIDAGGVSFGVLGCGIDVIYPPENKALFEKTLEKGGIISEYPLGTKPLGPLFPRRNRIISGLSDAVVVIEAKEKSGTLITVEHALNQGRDVFAVPGRITDLSSIACNRLISEGAGILNDTTDILKNFGIYIGNDLADNTNNIDNKALILAKDLEKLYLAVDLHPKTAEEIVREAKMEYNSGLSNLIKLEMEGLIYEPSPNYYSRV